MPDLICPLLEIPDYRYLLDSLSEQGISIVTACPWNRDALKGFISKRFGQGWVDEALRGFNHTPITVVLALKEKEIIGFAAYEVSAPGFFGPTGVDEKYRGHGVGKALFYESMEGMRRLGYVYGIVGAPGPVDFYQKAMKCMLLPADWKTIYSDTIGITAMEHR